MKHIRNRRLNGSRCSGLCVASLFLLTLTGCQEEFGGYYEQSGGATSTSKEVLESRNDCNTYLQLVDKTLFSKQVEGSGQYTFLVPTDEAFDAFFANNPYGYKSVDDIPEDVAARMVSSWMMYNSYPCDTLANVLESFNSWAYDHAFKHKTPSYDVLRQETLDGTIYQVYEYPVSGSEFSLSSSSTNSLIWNNYRFLPIFTNRFNVNNSISSEDWQKVIGSEFSPYGNYVEAGIIDAGSGSANPGDLFCQNGVIHLVNKVVMPLENLDAMIRTYGDGSAVDQPDEAKTGAWGLLRNILYHKKGNGEYQFLNYEENSTARHYFENAYPDEDMSKFLIRNYKNSPFRLNVEEYINMQAIASSSSDLFYDNYNGGMTFYLPTTDAMLDYINNRLFRYVGNKLTTSSTQAEFDAAFNKMSDNVLSALWFSMQSNGMIWPSQFESSAINTVGSSEHINGYDDSKTYDSSVVAAGLASNGMWQITNFVPKTAAFEGVASRLLLDPAYSIEQNIFVSKSAFNNMLKSKLSGTDDVNMSLILWGDANAEWFDNIHYSTLLSTYATGEVGEETSINSNLQTTVLNSYIERETVDALDLEVDPLNGAYGGWAYTNTYNGEVIRYRKSGNTVNGQPEIQLQSVWSLCCNDANERAMWESGTLPTVLQQTEPTAGSYMSVVKDNGVEYINGNVYTATEHSAPLAYYREGTFGDGTQYYNDTWSPLSYLLAYLRADANSANPQHTIFTKFWNYYQTNKSSRANSDTISIGSGKWTIFVPTDAALQAAIDYGKTHDISLLRHPDNLPTDPTANDANWVDSVIYFLNTYITKSGCYADDGLSGLYETSEAWDGLSATQRQATSQYLVTTNSVVTDMDRVGSDGNVIKAWDGLLSGGRMSGYVTKTGDGNKLQYFGRPYTSGAFEVVNVYNSNEMTDSFDNTVVREAGQSNIMAPNCMIHSLNGFIIYKIASH